ncbi:MAG: 30S ribosomal protein S25e [Sulfolobales archaeon]
MGTKGKKPISAMEKRQKKTMETAKKEKEKPSKKEESRKGASVLNEEIIERAKKEIKDLKVITPYTIKEKMGVSYSIARQLLRYMESENIIRLYSANRRIKIYVPAAS